jgi:hypothetical protein
MHSAAQSLYDGRSFIGIVCTYTQSRLHDATIDLVDHASSAQIELELPYMHIHACQRCFALRYCASA